MIPLQTILGDYIKDLEGRLTITIPEAAALLGVGRNTGYEAAKSGELPTIRIRGRLLVPVPAFRRMLGIEPGSLTANDPTPANDETPVAS